MKATLQAIYGTETSAQLTRYRTALAHFTATYGPGEVLIFRAPGRVNLIGEHTDYNHGYVMPVALDRDILLLLRPRNDGVIRLCNMEETFSGFLFKISPNIPSARPGDWSNYARGVAQTLAQTVGQTVREITDKPLRGVDGLIVAALPHGVPRGAGLSSSSALTVVLAVGLAHINQWQPSAATLAQFCSEAEWYVGTRGGIMDQFISLLAEKDHALFLDCRPDADGKYQTQKISLPAGYRLLIVNSGIKHENARGDFNRRVAACRAGVELLRAHYPNITHLRDVEQISWAELSPWLPEEISVGALWAQGVKLDHIPGLTNETLLKVRARCRHVWSENRRVLDAINALQTGDVTWLGELLQDAHASARDDYAISCPEIEHLVSILSPLRGVVGTRLTGAGWGGCVVALVEKSHVDDVARTVQARYLIKTGMQAETFACLPGHHASFVIELP